MNESQSNPLPIGPPIPAFSAATLAEILDKDSQVIATGLVRLWREAVIRGVFELAKGHNPIARDWLIKNAASLKTQKCPRLKILKLVQEPHSPVFHLHLSQ